MIFEFFTVDPDTGKRRILYTGDTQKKDVHMPFPRFTRDYGDPFGQAGDYLTYAKDVSRYFQAEAAKKSSSWIMTDDQRNRLTSLAQEIALENDLSLSVRIDKDGLSIGLYSIVEAEEAVEETDTVEEVAVEYDPVERLAQEVSQLNGYALGAFMQMLMKLGAKD